MKTMNKIVVKVGTSTLTQGGKKLSRKFMLGIVQQLSQLREEGVQVVLVTSGAVAAGKDILDADSKEVCASIGQVKLMQTWAELFSIFDVSVGQVLLTKEDFEEKERFLHTQKTLFSLLQSRALPVINENDPVTTTKTKVGDNDNLAALVAKAIGADAVILLTDQEGLFTKDPRLDAKAELISVVKHIDEKIFSLAGGSSSLGTGGMLTKIEAAQLAAGSGTRTIIACSTIDNVLLKIVQGQKIGTVFLEEGGKQ